MQSQAASHLIDAQRVPSWSTHCGAAIGTTTVHLHYGCATHFSLRWTQAHYQFQGDLNSQCSRMLLRVIAA